MTFDALVLLRAHVDGRAFRRFGILSAALGVYMLLDP